MNTLRLLAIASVFPALSVVAATPQDEARVRDLVTCAAKLGTYAYVGKADIADAKKFADEANRIAGPEVAAREYVQISETVTAEIVFPHARPKGVEAESPEEVKEACLKKLPARPAGS